MRLRHAFLIAIAVLPLGLAAQGEARPAGSPPEALGQPQAAAAGLILEGEAARYLGLGLADALALFGAPSTVYPLRGAEPWQDDVVFAYDDGFSLFWFGDRLWQIRFTAPYQGPIYGASIGDAADKVYALLGQPWEAAADACTYRLPYQGFPVRLRLAMKEGRLADAYLYRADF